MKTIDYINNIYNNVLICPIYKTGDREKNKYLISSIDAYKKALKKNNNLYELIGGKSQIKPCFDCDSYYLISTTNEERLKEKIINCKNNGLNKVLSLFPDKIVKISYRNVRKVIHNNDKCYKISFHYIVQNVRISWLILGQLLINNGFKNDIPFDLSIYKDKKLFSLPFGRKAAKTGDEPATPLIFDEDKTFLFDYCASYIKEEYENWDIKLQIANQVDNTITNVRNIKQEEREIDEDLNSENDEENKDTYLKLQKILSLLSDKRASFFDDWLNVFFAIINIGKKEGFSREKIIRLIHHFSKNSKTNYNEDLVDDWINKNYDKVKDGYCWRFLYEVCIKQDNPEYYENLTKSYYNVKKNFEKTWFKCLNPIMFIKINHNITDLDDEPFTMLCKKQLLTTYENLYCFVKQEDNKNKSKTNIKYVKKHFIDLWLKDVNIRTYNKLLFTPQILNENDNKIYYNTFNGFKASKLDVYKDYESIKPILHHIEKVICNDNKDYNNWFLQYFAQIIQNPIKKTDTIIVLKGKQGCGKSILFDNFANKIIGIDYSISTGNAERHLLGGFNSCIFNKLFAVCNEIGNDMRGLMDKLKDLATTPNIVIEKKNKDPIRNPNYINIVMTTNNNNPLDIAEDDRRICWLNCNSCYIGNVEYFKILGDCLNDDKVISSFYHYLLEEVKITIVDFQVSRPITKEYKAIQRINTPNYIKFLIDYTFNKDFEDKYINYKNVISVIIKTTELYRDYKEWCDKCRFTPFNKSQFEERITDINGIIKCIYDGYKCFRFIKTEINNYLNKHKEREEDIEVISDEFYV